MKTFNYQKGKKGEVEARNFLERLGMELLEMNYRSVNGEIDLIMSDDKTLVFVEVKMKSDDVFGSPEEMITKYKLSQVRKVAEIYLLLNPKITQKYLKYRIDGVCITGNNIRHYKNLY